MKTAAIALLTTWKTQRLTVNAVIASTLCPTGVRPAGVGIIKITRAATMAMPSPNHFMLLAAAAGGAAGRAATRSCVVAISDYSSLHGTVTARGLHGCGSEICGALYHNQPATLFTQAPA